MDEREVLKKGAERLGVPFATAHAEAFSLYLSELLKWNAKVNLTAITGPEEVAVKHFLDSLSLFRLLPEGHFSAADVGAGAGFPGLPLKIVRPDMALTLIEPARKKAAFLKNIARTLGLTGVYVVEEKVEDAAGEFAGRFDVVLSRAFREPRLLLPLAAPLLGEGGSVVLSVGPEQEPAPPEGWVVAREEEITLPFSDYKRTLIRYIQARNF